MSSPAPVVIIIEDEPQIRRFVRDALEAEGWRVHEADTAQRGVIEAGTRKPDLLLLDLDCLTATVSRWFATCGWTAASRGAGEASNPIFRFGDVVVDLVLRQVQRAGKEVHLTPIEYRLLSVLIASAGRVLTHRQLMLEVWGPAHVGQNHYLRIYMGQLRRKLEADPVQPCHLLTETAVGYRLVDA